VQRAERLFAGGMGVADHECGTDTRITNEAVRQQAPVVSQTSLADQAIRSFPYSVLPPLLSVREASGAGYFRRALRYPGPSVPKSPLVKNHLCSARHLALNILPWKL